MADENPPASDKTLQVYARWDARMKEKLRPLVTEELIAEHSRNPWGQHSDPLERVLNYFRRSPARGKYAVLCTRPHAEWRIIVMPGERGKAPTFLDDRRFSSEREAVHAVFNERVKELMV